MFFPFASDVPFTIHSSFFLVFLSKVDLILSQLSSETLIHKPSFFSLSPFPVPVPPYILKNSSWVLFLKIPVTYLNLFLLSLLTFTKDFTYCYNSLLLLWHNSLKSEFSQIHVFAVSPKWPITPQLSNSVTPTLFLKPLTKVIIALYQHMVLPLFCTPSSSYFSWSVMFPSLEPRLLSTSKIEGRRCTKQISPHLGLMWHTLP